MTGDARPETVLVLCTGNSCRSVMGEALINSLGKSAAAFEEVYRLLRSRIEQELLSSRRDAAPAV